MTSPISNGCPQKQHGMEVVCPTLFDKLATAAPTINLDQHVFAQPMIGAPVIPACKCCC
jgi:hypothetical protein